MKRRIGPFAVHPIGLGCMSLSHAYGSAPPRDDAVRLLNQALDLGYDFLDTAALYGFGANEQLLAEAIGHRRAEYVLASKCGMTGVDGKRVIDGRPETLLRTIDESLRRLRTDVIDLYYLHRWDKAVPIAESVGAMARMVEAGKVRAIGLSEVSAATLRMAHAVHPIAAVQNEYSPWSRNVELGVLAATRDLNVALVAFSPLGRGFFTGAIKTPAELAPDDIRHAMPRFQSPHFDRNLPLLKTFRRLAEDADCTPAQLSLAWVLAQGSHVIAIPGTTSVAHLEENYAGDRDLNRGSFDQVKALVRPEGVAGQRYSAKVQCEIDTERFDFECAA